MSRQRASARHLHELRELLTGRDLALLSQVAELRFMTGRHLAAVYFDGSEHQTPAAAGRAARRRLEFLYHERLLTRLERRIGGIRAGSASFVYALGPVGDRLLNLPGARRRHHEPSRTFLDHSLAITELVVELTLAARHGNVDLLTLQTEPRCWRQLGSLSGTSLLRPDLYLAVGTADYEYRWFIEVDLGTEHLPTLLRKCTSYDAYYRSGREQASHGVAPRVLWLMHNQTRADRLRAAIERTGSLTPGLFVVSTATEAVRITRGGQP